MVQPCATQHSTFQVHEENLYFYGGKNGVPSNYLSVFNTKEGSKCEIARHGSIPPQSDGAFSAIFEGKMLIFDTQPEQIYSFNLEIKPVKEFITVTSLSEALSFKENSKDVETLEKVSKLLEENKIHDIVFKVQNKEFPAHKNVISLRSDVLSHMFSSGMQESHSKEINIPDNISPEAFEAFLEYAYRGILPSRYDILKDLIVFSDKYVLKKLQVHCERTLANKISKENAVELYELSMAAKAEDLKDATLQFMGNYLGHFAKQLISVKRKPEETVV